LIGNVQSSFPLTPWISRHQHEPCAGQGASSIRRGLVVVWAMAVLGGCGNDQPRAFSPVEYQRPRVIPWPPTSAEPVVLTAPSADQVGESAAGAGGGERATSATADGNRPEVEGGHSPDAAQGGGAGALTGYTGSAGGVVFDPAARSETP
jgi:hypothetical protein